MNTFVEVDILILSYAQTEELKNMTINAVQSLIDSEDTDKIRFNIIIIESQKDIAPFQYEHTTTIYPEEEFNFHRYLNIGINLTSSSYICLCNNDLLFQKEWASEILRAFAQFPEVYSASPMCPRYPEEKDILPVKEAWLGYRVAIEVQGACLFFKRDVLKFIGQLDPNFKFYAADLDYADTLRVLNLKHLLVRSAIVFHLVSKTLIGQNAELKYHLTHEQDLFYRKKWFHRIGRNWKEI